ncbi:bifunctional methylenetetrahydrofolate dehydrogenase/methenyltetrahydrofolate cyclohydrolase FolD [soil metagenome]
MLIDGRLIAQSVFDNLTKKVGELKEEGITPHLAVILIGDDPSSKAYVRQKELKLTQIGGAITTHRFSNSFTQEELVRLIKELNDDSIVHGIIVQRPLPPQIDKDVITDATSPEKDVDGFLDNSPFEPPIAMAVMRILREIFKQTNQQGDLHDWLKTKKIAIIGKGYTAGAPIIKLFTNHEIPLTIIDSSTTNRQEILASSDIVISAVGKTETLKADELKDGVIVIGVGMHRGEDDKLHGDYDEESIGTKAAFYTPVPGGIGPVNVAMLLVNLIKAAETV